MPLYEYECKKCHHRFEEIQKVSDRPIKKCPKCRKGTVVRLVSAPAVHFKGTGWYITDYARKNAAPGASEKEDTKGKDEKVKKESGSEPVAKKEAGKKPPRKD